MKHEITAEEKQKIEIARKANKNKRIEKRLQVLVMRAEGKTLAEIVEATGFHRSHINNLIAMYREKGLSAIIANHYLGNRRNMTFDEEAALLEDFKKRAEAGQMVDVREIKAAYEEKVGHSIGGTQIYYVLKRHGWRKVMPRRKHPNKASAEVIATSKNYVPNKGTEKSPQRQDNPPYVSG